MKKYLLNGIAMVVTSPVILVFGLIFLCGWSLKRAYKIMENIE